MNIKMLAKIYTFLLCTLFSSFAFSMNNDNNNNNLYNWAKKAVWILFPVQSLTSSITCEIAKNKQIKLFYEAIASGNVEQVEYYVKNYPQYLKNYWGEKMYPYYLSPQKYAHKCGQSQLAEIFIKHKNSIASNIHLQKAFQKEWSAQTIGLLLESPNIKRDNFIQCAGGKSINDLVNIDNTSARPFGMVFLFERYDVLNLFLEKKYDPNCSIYIRNDKEIFPLQYMIWAISRDYKANDFDITDISFGDNVTVNFYGSVKIIYDNNIINELKVRAICLLLAYGAEPLKQQDEQGNTIFHIVAQKSPACDIAKYATMLLWHNKEDRNQMVNLLSFKKNKQCIFAGLPKPIMIQIGKFLPKQRLYEVLNHKNNEGKTVQNICIDRMQKTNDPKEQKQFLAASTLFSLN